MTNTIIRDIRRLKLEYLDKCGEYGKFICLDANAEARLAAWVVYKSLSKYKVTDDDYATIDEVLENGINTLPLGYLD